MIYLRMNAAVLCTAIAFILVGPMQVMGQDGVADAGPLLIEPDATAQSSDMVTINVRNAQMGEVLKAYSLQTGQSIVVGPDVVSDNVNVRLNNIPWEEALDVILKPYGFGYRVVGKTVVVSKLENIVTVEGIEPLVSRVFKLKFLDAYDIEAICTAQLTGRGKFTILETKSLPGWEFGGSAGGGGSAAASGGIRERAKKESIQKSKTFVITDVPSTITQVDNMINEIDIMPQQVLIEAKFLEVSSDFLTDIGLDFATGQNGVLDPGVQLSNPGSDNRWGLEKNDSGFEPNVFEQNPVASIKGSAPFNSGLQMLFSRVGGENFQVLLHALEQNGEINVLSAPKVLTLNNQEAAMLVGTKYPIIESQSSGSGSGTGSGTTSTTLEYYENIGIQLNVVPQICDGQHINMIVHPAVSQLRGFQSGKVGTNGDETALTDYPILQVREAETQIMIESGSTVVIGGLQEDRETEVIHKVPLLGDIPFLGRLFRRETMDMEKIDLLIFIKATIVDNGGYALASAEEQQQREAKMNLEMFRTDKPVTEDEVVQAAETEADEAPVQAEEAAADTTDDSSGPAAVAEDVVEADEEVELQDLLTQLESVERVESGQAVAVEPAPAAETEVDEAPVQAEVAAAGTDGDSSQVDDSAALEVVESVEM